MRTRQVKKCGSDEPEYLITDPPYTVFGHTSLPESFGVTMKVGGLRKMIAALGDDDTFRIEMFAGTKGTEYSFIENGRV